jgi:hypothetical protein
MTPQDVTPGPGLYSLPTTLEVCTHAVVMCSCMNVCVCVCVRVCVCVWCMRAWCVSERERGEKGGTPRRSIRMPERGRERMHVGIYGCH